MNFDREYIRNKSPLGVEDKEYDKWIRGVGKTLKCFYCSGEVQCADHVLGGYFGKKANGYLKVPSCYSCNLKAEKDPKMHRDILHRAVRLLWIYIEDKRQEEYAEIVVMILKHLSEKK